MATRNGKNPHKNPRFNGAAILPGNPGNRGGQPGKSGRKPDAFISLCRDLVESPKTQASVRQILSNHKHPHFAVMYKHLTDHAYGKPAQSVTGPEGGPIVVRVVRDDE
jgi:hypothetical protein